MSEPIAEFLDAMRSAGVNIDTGSRGGPHPIADGKLHRADALGKKAKKNQHVWYVLHTDSPASGAFGDLQLGVEDTWTEKKPSAMTRDERAALKARMAETARAREEERRALNAAATEAGKLIMSAKEPAPADHPYLSRKKLAPLPGLFRLKTNVRYTIEPGEDPRTARAGCLIVPLYRAPRDGEQKSQFVSVQLIRDDGDKRFLKGTAKEGSYHPIGKAPAAPGDVIIIAEGYATAARVHHATGRYTVAAFDAGNLKPVALSMRKRYTDALILIAADNDRYTTQPIENPGLTKAREAADAVRGRVAVPTFDDDDTQSTDFDDLAQKFGLDRVTETIERAINPPAEEPPHHEAPPFDPAAYGFDDSPPAALGDDGVEHPLATFGSPHFRCLGVDGTTCYYQPKHPAEIISFSAAAHKPENLMTLAPLQWWEAEFPTKTGVDWKAATNACIRACKRRGIFSPERVHVQGALADERAKHRGDVLSALRD